MDIDILGALNNTPRRGNRLCKLAEILDDIPDDTPGKAELAAAVENPDDWPAARLTVTFSAIGKPVSANLICDHRAQRCLCFR